MKTGSKNERLLSVKFPNIANEWDFSNNGELTPDDVTYGSNKKVYWICPICKESYPCTISNRTSKARKGCPYCCHNPKVNSKNNLAVKNFNLAKEWDYSLNTLTPSDILPNSNKKYYWIVPIVENHILQPLIIVQLDMLAHIVQVKKYVILIV
jgi:hypothetical protein